MIELVNPAELGGRPSGYTHAVVVEADRLVFLSGQIGTGHDHKIVGGGVVKQFEQALGNLLTALRAAGGKPDDLVSTTVYIVDIDDYKAHTREIGEVWRRLVGSHYPAAAGIGVNRLWEDEALVEIQGYAAVMTNRSTQTASSDE